MRGAYMMRCLVLLVMMLVALSASLVRAQPLPADPKLTVGECENGLRYIVVRHRMPPLRAQVWLHVAAGSMNETDGQRGATHFLSHMAFRGSENMPPELLKQMLREIGSPKADDNSHTTFDETVYKLSLRDATTDAVGQALRFLKEVGSGLTFPELAMDEERAAILAEQTASANVSQRVQEFLLSQISPGSIIGDRVRLGTPASVKALTREDLRAYYRTWYVPSNMTVIFVGDMDAAEVVRLIQQTMGVGPKAARPAPPDLGIKAETTSRAAVFTDAELKGTQAYIFHVLPCRPPLTTVEELRWRVIDSVAVDVFNRRMHERISRNKFPHSTAGASSQEIPGVCQLVGVYVSGEAGKWREALTSLATEMQRARLHGFYASEVQESKDAFLSQWEKNVKNEGLRQAAAYAQTLVAAAGNGDVIMSPSQTLEQLQAIFAQVDERVVSEHFARMMDPTGALFMVAAPTGSDAPRQDELLAAGIEAVSVTPEPEAEFVKPTALMTGRPKPGSIVEEKMHDATGVWNGWFNNGVVMHHRHMDVAKGQATITVALAGGVIEENELTRGLTEAGSVAWSRPATSKLPSFVIQELTENTIFWGANRGSDTPKLRLGGGPGLDNQLLVIAGPVEHMETGMQLLHLMLTDPMIEPPGLEEWKAKQVQGAERRTMQGEAVFSDAMLDMLYPKTEPRIRPLTIEQVGKVTLEDAQAWVRRQVLTSPIEVSVVGDITREQAVELVGTYIGSLPARERISETTLDDRRAVEPPPGPHRLTREAEGLAALAFIMAGFRGTDSANMEDARLLGLASQILTERLNAMEATDPLIQNASVRSQPSQEFPGTGVFGAYGLVAPEKVENAMDRIFALYDAMAKDGPTVEELAHAKQQVSHQLEAALANPDFWSEQLSLLTYRARSLDDLAQAQTPYQSITPEDVRRAVAKYHTLERRMQLVLLQKGEVQILQPKRE